MLSTIKKKRIVEILNRLSKGENVSLKERVEIQQCADRDPTIFKWLKRARRVQSQKGSPDSIDDLLNDLDIASPEADENYKLYKDDLGEWFSGAPSWLSRS